MALLDYITITKLKRKIILWFLASTSSNVVEVNLVLCFGWQIVNNQIENLNYMNDKKYESLRKKLDKLGFTQTLNPDSVELVDKIYSQLFKCMNELDQ